MTQQSGGSGIPANQAVAGVLSGNILAPSFAAGSVPAELGYVAVTTPFLGETGSGMVDVTGLTLTVVVGVRGILVAVFIPLCDFTSVNGRHQLSIQDVTAGAEVGGAWASATNGLGNSAYGYARLTPSPGSRQYKIQANYTGGDAGHRLFASATDPMHLRISEY